jgi:diguanylate cyclase (GGDEF)-like protein
VAERARAALANEVFVFEGRDLTVTASGGVAELAPGETSDELVKRADESLYVSKENGRNRGYWHDGTDSHPIILEDEIPESAPAAATEEEAKPATDEAQLPRVERFERTSGISSREVFLADVQRRMSERKRGGAPVSVLLVEVDRLQELEAQYGNKAGEVALRAAAQFLKASMRDMDHISLFADRVFGLLLPGAGINEVGIVSERIRAAIERCELPLHGESLPFSVSMGAAEVIPGEDLQTFVARAEGSLEAARTSGGNCSYSANTEGECQAVAAMP